MIDEAEFALEIRLGSELLMSSRLQQQLSNCSKSSAVWLARHALRNSNPILFSYFSGVFCQFTTIVIERSLAGKTMKNV